MIQKVLLQPRLAAPRPRSDSRRLDVDVRIQARLRLVVQAIEVP